jgi:hypothetical protein
LEQDSPHPNAKIKKLSFMETVQNILEKDGAGALWRGIGPALVLVINPVLQYTIFEQLKNFLIARKTVRLKAAGLAAVVAVLSDWDFFFLGALSKLCEPILLLSLYPVFCFDTPCSRDVFDLPLHACHIPYQFNGDFSNEGLPLVL